MTYRSEQKESDPLKQAIMLLWAAFGRKADQATRDVWAKSLRPHDGPTLMRVFRESAEGEHLPNLGVILAKVNGITKAATAYTYPELTPEERRRADQSAILGMLWLHYAKGWGLHSFSGHVLARSFGKDPQEALAAASEIYDKATVIRWMEDQEKAGN